MPGPGSAAGASATIAPGQGRPPLVSCLCVTRDRPQLLRRAVNCFRRQDYEPRELVVVFESDDAATRGLLDGLRDPAIRRLEIPASPKLSLGALRNLGVASCRGHYLAQWDDDDWYAPNRLGAQIAALRATQVAACVLARWILYDAEREAAFMSVRRPWEGSLVAERSALPAYPELARGEDTVVIGALLAAGRLVALDDPWQYVYVFHGANTWERSHFERNLVAHATRLAPHEEARVRAWIGVGGETP
jgi:glycosyltransferase involved in cell wall biosynthesis